MSRRLPDPSKLANAHVETKLVSLGRGDGAVGNPFNPPLVMASNFKVPSEFGPESENPRNYARGDATETWEALEQVIGSLEGGYAISFSSGMAAAAAIIEDLPAGSKIVLPADCYMGVTTLSRDAESRGKLNVVVVNMTNESEVTAALDDAALLWLETPSNPLFDIMDISTLAGIAHDKGALVAVDNTFATPLLQNPIALGADFVMHSATKFIGGHSDLLMGIVVCATPELFTKIADRQAHSGATPGSLESYLALRGTRTLALRLERSQYNAGILAERLEAHPKVSRVLYPGLATHPGHDVALKQMSGFGSVLSFVVDTAEQADKVCTNLTFIQSATSLGSVESTIERRGKYAGQEHLPAGLIRLSVGCEHVEDLWADLNQALNEYC